MPPRIENKGENEFIGDNAFITIWEERTSPRDRNIEELNQEMVAENIDIIFDEIYNLPSYTKNFNDESWDIDTTICRGTVNGQPFNVCVQKNIHGDSPNENYWIGSLAANAIENYQNLINAFLFAEKSLHQFKLGVYWNQADARLLNTRRDEFLKKHKN